jgi:hypothetical protein
MCGIFSANGRDGFKTPGRLPGTPWLLFFLGAAVLAPARAESPWRVWSKADGLMESFTFGLSQDAGGRILVKVGDVSQITVLDGYQITGIVNQHSYGRLLSDPGNGVWTFDPEGILIHGDSGWRKYPDNEIAAFAKTSRMSITPWFLYSTTRRLQEEWMDVVPQGNNSGLVLFPDRILQWNRASGQKRLVRVAAETLLTQFRDVRQSLDGGFWLSGENGLAYLRKAGGDFVWTEFKAPGGLTNLQSPVEGRDGEVFLSARRPDGRRALIRFAGRARGGAASWTEIFVGGGESLSGWRGPDGTI